MSAKIGKFNLLIRIACFFFVTLFFEGCAMVGPDFKKQKADLPERWSTTDNLEPPGQTKGMENLADWWTAFNDPVLNSLIEKALNQNLSLQIAGLRILEARAELGFASGSLYPQQQRLKAGMTRVKSSKNAANTMQIDLDYSDYDGGFDAVWELDFWGRFRRAIEAADANLQASIADYDDVMVTLTAEVARTYILIRTLEERIILAKENAKIQQQSLQIAQEKFNGGIVTELDVQQAMALLRDTQARIPRLETQLYEAEHALSILLGILPGELPENLSSTRGIPSAPPRLTFGIPAELLRRRPDIRRAEMLAASQCSRIGVAKADLYPHFTLIGSIGLSTSDSSYTKAGGVHGSDFGDMFNADSLQFFAGPSVSWDILNYGRIKNKVRIQDARFQQLLVQYRNTVLYAAREVEDALIAFLRSQDENSFLKDGVRASIRAVDISLLQYSEGLIDYQRVLDAERLLTQQQDMQTEASSFVALNLISIYKALGGGWRIRQDKDIVSEKIKEIMRHRTDWGDLLN